MNTVSHSALRSRSVSSQEPSADCNAAIGLKIDMATNRPIVEVLHYAGATDSFVSGQFQRHFLILGFKGGALGGGAAILLFAVVEAANTWLAGTAGGDEIAGLFGNLSIAVTGYLAILLQIVFMALVTAFASRRTVNRTLETID